MNFLNISPTNFGWGYGYGFFSNYRVCLEHLILNENTNKIPYIDWSKTTWVEGFDPWIDTTFKTTHNPFNDWFEQIIPDDKIDNIEYSNHIPNDIIIHHGMDYFNTKDIIAQRNVEQKFIKVKDYITDKINDIYEKEFVGYNVLGIMARGCEYNLHHPFYGNFGIDHYIIEIQKVLNDNPEINKIFVVSEDSDYIEKITNSFNNVFSISNVFRRTDETMEYINRVHYWPNISTKREEHCKLLGEEVIIQTKLLGKCAILFGRHSGVLCGAILWGEKIKKLYKI